MDSFLGFRVEEDASLSYRSCICVKDNVTKRCLIEGVGLHCPKSCNTCGTDKCEDGELSFKYETGSKKTHTQLVKLSSATNQNAHLTVFRKYAEEVVNTVICRIVNTCSR